MKNKSKGFTLIELLVVIAIIGILASVVLASLNSARNKSKDAKIVAQLKSMIPQAQLYTGQVEQVYWATAATGVPEGSVGANLFTNSTASTNSLYRLATGFPSGTFIYYSTEPITPANGGRWAIAAATSKGSYCVDYTNAAITKTGTFTGATKFTEYPNLDYAPSNPTKPAYLCN